MRKAAKQGRSFADLRSSLLIEEIFKKEQIKVMELKETTIKRNDIYNGRILKVHVDDAETAEGKPCKREVVEHPGGVCVDGQ